MYFCSRASGKSGTALPTKRSSRWPASFLFTVNSFMSTSIHALSLKRNKKDDPKGRLFRPPKPVKQKYSQQSKLQYAAGELEGTRSRSNWISSHQKRLTRLFDEHSEIFCENSFSQKMWRFFEAHKKSTTLCELRKRQPVWLPFKSISTSQIYYAMPFTVMQTMPAK